MSNEAVYHDAPKTEEPCETTTTTVKVEPEVVEQSDRGLFGFGKKDEEEKKCEDGVISSEFEQKVQVTEPEPEEKKGSLLEKFHRSNSSSSSSSDEECEDGEKKKKKKSLKDKVKEKIEGHKEKKEEEKVEKYEADTSVPIEKCEEVAVPTPTPAPEEKKGFMEKIKEKLPGGHKKEAAKTRETRNQNIEKIKESTLKKHDAEMKRERALAYAFAYQQEQQQNFMHPASDNAILYPNDDGKQQWGWNWLESWMASQPYHTRPAGPHDGSYLTHTNDDVSVKTVEMDLVTPLSSDYITTGRLSGETLDSAQHSKSKRQSGSDYFPSYMAPTQSAKAKVRAQNPGKQKAQPVKRTANGLSFDTSSSGGNVMYQIPRSPSPNPKGYINGSRGQSKWSTGYSPDSSGGDDGSTSRYGWRHHFG